jgi:hypothetical protein
MATQQPQVNKTAQRPYDILAALPNHTKKRVEADIDSFQKAIEEPKRIISEIGAISDSTIELAKKNPNAAKTLGAQIAKIMQGSKLTDTDVVLYTGRMGITNWLTDFVKELATGHVSESKAKDIKETLTVYNDALRKSLQARAKNYANTIKNEIDPNLNVDLDSMAKLYYDDLPMAPGKVKMIDPNGKPCLIDADKVDLALKRKFKKAE